MGLFNLFKRKHSNSSNLENAKDKIEFEEVPVLAYKDKSDNVSRMERARKIKKLRDCSAEEALNNLLLLAQFDDRGEIAIHASMALATRAGAKQVKEAVCAAFNEAPAVCEAGYPPKTGVNVFPKSRLLHILAWMKDTDSMKKLLDESGFWAGAMKAKDFDYKLCADVNNGIQSVVDSLVYFEYLDEAGDSEVMRLAIELYPELGFNSETWRRVRMA